LPQQAQIYFAGQSRYIGVFESAYDAAAAYEIVRERLDQARKRDSRGNSNLTMEGRSQLFAQLFDDARLADHGGVFENKEDNEYNASLNYANKSRPLNSLQKKNMRHTPPRPKPSCLGPASQKTYSRTCLRNRDQIIEGI
jgi:hypothetical protein